MTRSLRKRAGKVLLILAALILCLVLLLLWLLGRERTLQYAIEKLLAETEGQVTMLGSRGGLYEGLAFDRVEIKQKNQRIVLEQGVVRWDAGAWLTRTLVVSHASVKKVTVDITGISDEPMTEPAALALPFRLVVPQATISEIELRRGGRSTPISAVEISLRHDRQRWDVERLALQTPWGAVSGKLAVAAQRPFDLAGDVRVTQEQTKERGDAPYAIAATLTGSLADLRGAVDAQVTINRQPLRGKIDARVMPFARDPLVSVTLDVPSLSPRLLNASAPDADLSLRATLAPAQNERPGTFAGKVKISNRSAGTLDQQRLPLTRIDADFIGDASRIDVKTLLVDLGAAGQLAGTAAWRAAEQGPGDIRASLQTKNLNLAGVHARMKPTVIGGTIALQPAKVGDALRVVAQLAEKNLSLQIDAAVNKESIKLERAQLAAGKSTLGTLDLQGKVALIGQRAFDLTGQLKQFNPAALGRYPDAALNADVKLKGLADTAWQVRTDVALANSRLMNRPLSGKASMVITAQSLTEVDIALALGGNRLNAQGGFGLDAPADKARDASTARKLVWSIDAPRLADLGGDFFGSLTARGEAVGDTGAGVLTATLEGRDLRIMGEHRLKTMNGRARVDLARGAKPEDAVIAAEFMATDYASSKLALSRLSANLAGTRGAHVLKLAAANADLDLRAEAQGALDAGPQWRGQLVSLVNRGQVPFNLQTPVSVAGSAGQIEVGAANINLDGGFVRLASLQWRDGGIVTRGSASGLPLALAVSFSEALKRNVESTLKLGAEWDIATGTLDAKRAAQNPVTANASGSLRVFRESGDLVFLGDSRLPAGLEQLELTATLKENELRSRFNAVGRQIGRMQIEAATRAARREGVWGVPGSAPLQVKGDIDVPTLKWASRLMSEPGLTVDGALKMTLAGEGTFGTPLLRGTASAQGLQLRWADQGINYRDGTLEAEFTGDSVNVKRLTLLAGEGRLNAQGGLTVSSGKTSGQLAATVDRFEAVSRPDRLVVASGDGALRLDDNRLGVTGKLRADRGFFELPEKTEVVISDDVVIVGRATAKESARMKTRVDLNLDLGEQFKVRGAGLNGRLAGTLRVVSADAGLPRAVGTLRIEEGTYTVYGQKLTVERGLLSFSGPIHNPGVNLLAVRKLRESGVGVEAGVEVTGSANAPKAKLVSTPNVSETEKLSWLVLGRGLENSSKADFGLLSAAASGLLGSGQGASLQSKIAGTLGVDEIGITPAGAGQEGFLSVGKRISSKLYATYEQGLGKVSNVFKIRYTISPRWSLQAQAGTESAADVLYTIAFD